MEKQWYVLHTYSGYEEKVKSEIEQRFKHLGLEDKLAQIIIPTEDVFEHRKGHTCVWRRRQERGTGKGAQKPVWRYRSPIRLRSPIGAGHRCCPDRKRALFRQRGLQLQLANATANTAGHRNTRFDPQGL